MRGYSKMSDEDRQSILKQHATVYDGYATGNVQSNMTPLTVYDATKDKDGITVDNKGNVKHYTNNKINEIAAKPLNYDEIEPAYDFESGGPQQSMTFYNVNNQKPAYRFKSKGPVDVFELEDDEEFDDLVDDDEDLQNKIDNIEESVKRVINFYINK
jgi:hypothetical protein